MPRSIILAQLAIIYGKIGNRLNLNSSAARMRGISNRQMNSSSKIAVTSASLIWLAGAVAAAVLAVREGMPGLIAVAVFACAALPSVLTILVALRGRRWPVARKSVLAILPWIALASGLVFVTGGFFSPAIATGALAPLFVLAFGWRSHVVEICVFALLGLAGSLLAAAFLNGALDDPALDMFSGVLSLNAIFAGALLLVAILRREPADVFAATALAPVRAGPEIKEDTPARTGPVMIVDVADDGRVRMVSGEINAPVSPRQKQPFVEAFDEPHRPRIEAALSSDGTRLDIDIGRAPLELIFDPHAAGMRVFMSLVEEPEAEEENLETGDDEALVRAHAAEEALAERTAFFASLGHELKTPLNAILGFSDLMRNELRGDLPEAYREYVELIHESGQDLLLTVEDILDYAKAESGHIRFDLEPVDLVASSESVIAQLSAFADRAGVSIRQKAGNEVWALADARAVRQIWQNLLSNAIKYSPRGSMVSIDARSGSSTVALSVRDMGAGMSASDLEQVARPFQQGSNAKGRAGTGLGLAVVKTFADLMQGKVIIDTAPGEGTRVRVILPKADLEETESALLETTSV